MEARNGIEEGMSRGTMFGTGVGAWGAGLVLAIVAGMHMQSLNGFSQSVANQPSSGIEQTNASCDVPTADVADPTDTSLDTAESPATFYPEDTIVGARSSGATEMQGQ